MVRFTNMSINQKLTTIILTTCTALLLLAGISMIATEFVTSRHATVEQLTLRAQLISRFSSAPLAFHREEDVEEVNEILSALQSDSHILAACAYDKDQRRFGEYARAGEAIDLPAQPPVDGHRFTHNYVEVSHPVVLDGKRIGTMYLRSDLGRIYNQMGQHAGIVCLFLIGAIAAVFILAPRLRRPITEPILALADVARRVTAEKDYSARAVKQAEDEVGYLTDAFNRMLGEVETRQSALLNTNESMQLEIAERRRAEDAVRTSEAQLQTIVENLGEGVIVSDLNGQILRLNRAALAFHGCSSMAECCGHIDDFADTFELADLDGSVLPSEEWPAARVLRGEKLHNWDLRIRRIRDDWQRIFSYGGTLVRDADGHPMMAVLTISDITERRQAAEKIRQLNADLEQRVVERTAQLQATNKELEAFSYSVSHDLRAPLRSIDGFSQTMLEDYGDKLDAEGHDQLQRVRAASQRMGHLIDDLLNLSRVTRGEMRREHVDLSALAREVTEESRITAPDRDAEFVIKDGLVADADPHLLRVLLTNLIGNAWKFTAKRPHTRIEFNARTDNGETIYSVSDNGAGFDMAYSTKLFGAFQRLHDAKDFAGTGIGLATVQRIVNRHGGRIWAESEKGSGATFHFTLAPPAIPL